MYHLQCMSKNICCLGHRKVEILYQRSSEIFGSNMRSFPFAFGWVIRLKWDCFISEGNCLPGEAKFVWLILLTVVEPRILPDFQLQEALQHPVVRMLIKTKWISYRHFFLRWIIFTFLTMFVSLDHLPKCTGAVHHN